jgi:hypothetical protein
MGEAKRRAALGRVSPDFTPEQRADIGRLVRSVELVTGGGLCNFRALMGQRALNWLGMSTRITWGAMVYRAGPNAFEDTLAFCNENGAAYHCWLEAGGDLIDFSVGDWRPTAEAGFYDSLLPDGGFYRSIQWSGPDLPSFWWRPTRSFAWGARGAPELGEAWYRSGGASEELAADLRAKENSPPMRALTAILRERSEQLKEDWRTGRTSEFRIKTVILSRPLARRGIVV